MIVVILCSLLAGGMIGVALTNLSMSTKIDELQNQLTALRTTMIPQYQVKPENVSLAYIYEEVRDAVVMITGIVTQNTLVGQQVARVQGSGFVSNFTGRPVIVTNFHVVNGATDVSVTFWNGEAYAAQVLGSDAYSDLAVLALDTNPSELKTLPLASSSTLSVGDFVVVVGDPFGLTGSMTTGIVSQLGRTITETATNFPIANIIQISAPINPGNSGGPLLNDKGQVVGITTAVVTNSQGIGFAIPSNTILRELPGLVTNGAYTQHPWLGIAGIDVDYDIATQLNLHPTYGMLITQVTSDSPADTAGLTAGTQQVTVSGTSFNAGGDVIIAINGSRVVTTDTLSTYLEEKTRPGQTISITLVRNGETLNFSVVLGTRPPPS